MLKKLSLIAALTALPAHVYAQAADDEESDDGKTGVGIDPTRPEYGGEVTEPEPKPKGAAAAAVQDGNRFEVRGYLRAPLRVGIGKRNDGQPGTELHSPAHIPDGSFTDWTYLDNMSGPWSELFFNYGSSRAKATVSIASFNQTISGYRDLQSQLGINQAFVSLNFPGLFGRFGDLALTAGSFSNRYGTAGKSDAGMYETYLFGRTRAVGETLTARLDFTRNFSVLAEHGVGAKLDVIPGLVTPMNPRLEYLPYSGPVPQGSTFLHHAHLGIELFKRLRVTGHYLTSWTPDDNGYQVAGHVRTPGRMTIVGGEIKLKGGVAGDGYLGFSHIRADHILPLADAIEVLHSVGGYNFKNNFFGRYDPRTGNKPPDDSGNVDSVLFQYSLSLGGLARYPIRFTGNGPDLNVTLFGMFSAVDSATNSHNMLKYGGELMYSPLSVLGIGVRGDLVQPNLSNREESFSVLSPKIVLRTSFLAHERITLMYSHYWNGSEAYASFPYDKLPQADKDALMLSASMWW